MISVHELTVDFGKRMLFDGISFVIGDNEKVALVGKNGAGKSTLIKIIAGESTPTSGSIAIPNGASIGYLPQVMPLHDKTTLRNEVLEVFSHIEVLRRRVADLQRELEQRSDHDSESYLELINRFTTANDRLVLMQQENHEAEMERTLIGLGFEQSDLDRHTNEFSGGWRMRIELAKILLRKPDILLLDEPTNHLDIESIQWLESFIKNSSAALLLVSHDRRFLDATTSRTIELELANLYDYKCPYSEYKALREERLNYQKRAYENQKKMIEDTEAFIERFRYKATKAVQVQSRIKQLEKIERIEFDEIDRSKIHFRFPPAARSGDFPLIIEDLAKAYGAHTVFSHVNMTLRRGDKVAFVGRNGEGKSTLVKCIIQEIKDYTGSLKIGHNIEIAYFAQHRASELPEDKTIREAVDDAAKGDIRSQIDNMLGTFLFGGEIADKKIGVLSGGERSRLAILLLLLEPANMLILDEPTHHLDIMSKDVLKEAIANFNGTVILVSHDRDFLDGLADRIYEFRHGKVQEYLGGIDYYLDKRAAESIEAAVNESKAPQKTQSESDTGSTLSKGQLSRARSKELRKLRQESERALSEIDRIEEEIAQLEQRLSTPEGNEPDLYTKYEQLKKSLSEAMDRWEAAEAALEESQQSE